VPEEDSEEDVEASDGGSGDWGEAEASSWRRQDLDEVEAVA